MNQSAKPLVIGYHLIWTGYGYWLPNDPRGSGSKSISSDIIADLGELHYGRKSIQPAGDEIHTFYDEATNLLKHARIPFDAGLQKVVGDAFAKVIEDQRYTCYACVVMPDHVHLLIRKHRDTAEQMIEKIKVESARAVRHATGQSHHPIWSGGLGWRVFLEHPNEIERTIRYINANPDPLRLPRQKWRFVKEYDRWPLHAGHSPNSPYAKALRACGRYP